MIAFDSTSLEVELDALGPLRRIGSGRRATVYELVNGPGQLAYKAFAADVAVDADALTRFVRFAHELDEDTADELLTRTAWPVNVVVDDGAVQGFVMPRAPAGFTVELRWATGRSTVPGHLELLLNDDAYLLERSLTITDEFRLTLLRDTAWTLSLAHRLGIGVGDPSLLFSQTGQPSCFLIGCDAMRLGDDAVLDTVESPDWRTGELGDEQPATPASDNYKLGLLAIRLFAGDPAGRDPDVVPGRLRPLVIRALDEVPEARPAAAEWEQPITAALRSPTGGRPPRNKNRPGKRSDTSRGRKRNTGRASASAPPAPTSPPAVKANRRFWWGFAAFVVPIAFIIGLIDSDDSEPYRSSSVPAARPTHARTNYSPPPVYQPTFTPLPPPRIPYSILAPSIRLQDICLRPIVLYSKGVAANPKVTDVISKSCPGHSSVTITAISTGADRTLRVSTRFTDDDKKCRRSTYTLAPEGDGYTIAGVTAPVAATGCL
jgi:eukaryotic-like serine/threonine-protein kinase